ncbi:hypothetical protein F4801DRAFT_585835 [Xylaria longipes]|nr:hypothetical protein F4801DRAFT_585835 [Xylaria longipes]
MEQEESTLPPSQAISASSLAISNGLEKVCTLIKDSDYRSFFLSADRECARFRIWANNIGAFQDAHSSSSLGHRLRGAKELRLAVVHNLKRLQALVERVSAIITGDIPNRATYDYDEFGSLCGPPVTELEKLLTNTKFSIGHLLRLSILIRRRRPRGRLPKLDTLNLDPGLDSRHRLGKRQDDEEVRSSMENPASTKATTYDDTLNPNSIDLGHLSMKPSFRTNTTTFSAFRTNETGGLSVPTLTDITFNGVKLEFDEEFECPYCRTIQVMETQNDWVHHVLSDLTPYACTFEDCSMDMYETRHEWFDHEMEKHRKTWRCVRCPKKLYASQAQLKEHIAAKHPGDFTPAQLPFLLEMCGERPDRLSQHSCPLCDSWDGGSKEDYSPDSFRRHLGLHLQELALSSLPPYIDGLEICYSDSEEADIAKQVDPAEGGDVVLCDLSDDSSSSSSYEPQTILGYNILWTAASLFEFNFDTEKRVDGYTYLKYQAGELFYIIAEKGELWLAANTDNPNEVGWIWNKHFAKLVE